MKFRLKLTKLPKSVLVNFKVKKDLKINVTLSNFAASP